MIYGTPVDELCREETFKHEKNGLDSYEDMIEHAQQQKFPEGGHLFRFKFYGMFHVKPAQDSYMLRARIAGGELKSYQMRGMAEMAQDWGGGYSHITTRNNLQIREIMPENTVKVLDKLVDIGITSRGAGADNIRNITATPTTGFDCHEFIDAMPYAKAMHHHILNNRDLYGLPRKFNISFDSGGDISVCADTNDIGFYAVKIGENADGIEPGVYWRLQLCGITGHKQFATDTGLLLKLHEAIPAAAAIIRVFVENGNRTNRKKARLKYLVDDWGIPKMLEETQKKLAFDFTYYDIEKCETSAPKSKLGYIGCHKQSDGNNYMGVVVPVGKLSTEQMHKIADFADKYGDGSIRLTVWQNLLIPHITDEKLEAAKQEIQAIGLNYSAASITGGLVACTGSFGCKFAAADTKGHAVALGKALDDKIQLDLPVNIHFTGCHHSCAQHYIGDIGLMGVPVKDEEGNTHEGYNIVLGGGTDDDQFVALEVFKGIRHDLISTLIEELLKGYLNQRNDGETFAHFTRRTPIETIQSLVSVA